MIIDLDAERDKRTQPDHEFVSQDEYGRPLYTFGVEYSFEGGEYVFHLVAYSLEDAEARVEAIRQSAEVYGQIISEIPL